MRGLEVDQLHKAYGGRMAVSSLAFSIAPGETVAFLGPNGAGKSTTMRMLAGRLDPDSGDARIQGFSITAQRREAQRRLGYLPETAPLYGDLSPREFLAFLSRLHGLSRVDRRVGIDRVAHAARIGSVMDQAIASLSKGYRRRVALAGAMIHDPAVLLLDEPTDGLDPNQKAVMRDWLVGMRAEKAILISTHQLDEVDALCTRALVIADGQVLADETPKELAHRAPDGRLDSAFAALTQSAAVEAARKAPAGP